MKKYLPKIIFSEFSGNVLKLMSGSALAQLIPLIAAPFLARIYTPEEFGKLALFLSLIQILGTVINGKYEQAIILPKDTQDAVCLVLICFIFDTVLSILLFLIVIIFKSNILILLNADDSFLPWLLSLPAVIWLFGIYTPLNYYTIRKKQYSSIATTNVARAVANNTTALTTKSLFHSLGLLAGQVIGYMTSTLILLRLFKNEILSELRNLHSLKSLRKSAYRYKDFPKYSIWGGIFNSLSINLNNFFINRHFSTFELGIYFYSFKYVNLPLSLISASFRQVFLQASTKEMQETGQAKKIFLNTVKKMLILAVPGFTIGFLIVEDLFAFIFGEEWRLAGLYAKILLPMFMVRFIASPLSVVNAVFERQKYGLIIQVLLLFGAILTIFIASINGFDILMFLKLYSFVFTLIYLIILIEEYLVVIRRI